jgi:hypothetical protein
MMSCVRTTSPKMTRPAKIVKYERSNRRELAVKRQCWINLFAGASEVEDVDMALSPKLVMI